MTTDRMSKVKEAVEVAEKVFDCERGIIKVFVDLARQYIAGEIGESKNATIERIAQCIAHRVCCSAEHNPQEGKLHGYCVVCGVPWPCEYVGKIPRLDVIQGDKCATCTRGENPDLTAAYMAGFERGKDSVTRVHADDVFPPVGSPRRYECQCDYSHSAGITLTKDNKCPRCGKTFVPRREVE